MLLTITLLTSLSFAALYPLCFWISYRDPLKNKFHRFHLGLPTIVASVTSIFILFQNIPFDIKFTLCVWTIILILRSYYYWHKESVDPRVITISCLIGIYALIRLQSGLIASDFSFHVISILSGFIFCSSLYAMNLGHWYLNVHGLSLNHLKRAVFVLGCFLVVRFIWDIVYLSFSHIVYLGENIPAFKFLWTLDGFLLSLGIIFGTIFPFLSLFFASETLKLKNTQSTTGILYVILCSVLIGDIAYKYYFIKFHIFL